MAIGGAIGGAVDPTHINGPKIGDGQQQSATDGAVIAWVQGTALIAGTICHVGPRRQIRHKDSGKGGPVTVTFTAVQSFAILVCESSEIRDSTVSTVLMVLQDGKLVYDVRPGSTMLADSYKWKANVDFLYGDEAQMPHPTLEAITGVGNTPAYRGSCLAVFKNFDVSQAGDRIPTFQFVVAQDTTSTALDSVLPTVSKSTEAAYFGGDTEHLTYDVLCFRQDFAIADVGTVGLRLEGIYDWARYRFIVQALYGEVSEAATEVLGDGVVSALGASGLVDTGWEASTTGDMSSFDDWFTAAGLDIPALNPIGTYTFPQVLDFPTGATGMRVYGFAFFGPGWASYPIDLTFAIADTSSVLDPEFFSPGYLLSSTGALWRPEWRPELGLTSDSPSSLPLQTIVQRVAKRGGLSITDLETAGLGDALVTGYPIARQANAADCLLPLLQAYFGYGSEYDAQLHFAFYGADATVVIDRADLIEGNDANEGAITSNLRNQATEFPRRIVASYMDPAQNFTVVNVPAERQATDVIAIGDQAFQIPVVGSADFAVQAAQKALKVAYAALEGTQEYSVPFAGSATYLSLVAGAPLQFQGKRYVLDDLILGNGNLKLTTRYDRQSAYTSNVQAILGNAPVPASSPYSGPTTLYPMNLPSQRPQDSVGVYIVAASTAGRDSWRGCNVQVSYDGLATWQNALQINTEGTIGTVALDEPTGGEPVTVDVVKYDLENATLAQLAAGANAFAIISSADITQLGQFSTATETMTGKRFELAELARSLGGTAAVPVVAGDRFTLMDAAYFLPIDPSFAGRTLYFRGVGFGEIAEDADIYSLVYTALLPTGGQQFNSEAGVALQSEGGFLLLNSET